MEEGFLEVMVAEVGFYLICEGWLGLGMGL